MQLIIHFISGFLPTLVQYHTFEIYLKIFSVK